MFESLSSALSGALTALRGRGKLTESNIREGLAAVRTALLEADVAYDVVDGFLDRVVEGAIGAKVLESLDPTQQLVGIVHHELVGLMGPVDHSLHLQDGRATVIMLCGLQGSGKTTSAAKLARKVKEQGRGVMLVAADLQRPAAIEQLAVLGRQIGVPVHVPDGVTDPVAVCNAGVERARREGVSVVILDTAGRLAIDEALMEELGRIDRTVGPDQCYLVVDAMTGQDAVRSAGEFHRQMGVTGVVLSKADGDARGGAALSVVSVVGVPIAFVGSGERLDDLEPFHADRFVSRMLGMGDVLSLIERAEAVVEPGEAERLEEKIRRGGLTLEDFRDQLRMLKRMGPLESILGMLPGMGGMKQLAEQKPDERQLRRIEAIIGSMTPDERRHADIIDGSRRKRIARGSGTSVEDVNRLLKQFGEMQRMLKMVGQMTGQTMAAAPKKKKKSPFSLMR